VNKAELVKALEERLGERKTALSAVDGFIDAVVRAVAKGEKVSIAGFGVFEKRRRSARTARNPATGEPVKVKATSVPAFRAGSGFKDVVSGAKKLERPAKKTTTAKKTAAKATATKSAAKSTARPATKSTARSTAAKSSAAKSTAAKKTAAAKKTTATKTTAAKKTTAKKAPATKRTTATAAKKTTAKKTATKTTAAKKTTARKR
jgi:DNA-binding protein HU-beta